MISNGCYSRCVCRCLDETKVPVATATARVAVAMATVTTYFDAYNDALFKTSYQC